MKRWTLRPANDFGRPYAERVRSLRRESGFLSAGARILWWGIVRLYLRVYHRLSVEGRSNIPIRRPFVLVANHSSHLDALTLSACLPFSLVDDVFALAAGDTFFTSTASSTFAAVAMNALPIWRSRTQREHLATLRQRLSDECCVYILFPEGTRSRDGSMTSFKPGLGSLVAETHIPVVPCFISGAHDAWPPRAAFPRPRRVGVRIGPPLSFPSTHNRVDGWRDIAAASEAAVQRLADDGAC